MFIINDDGDVTVGSRPRIEDGDLEGVQAMLQKDEAFTPAFSCEQRHIYRAEYYLGQEGFFGKTTALMLDSNIFGRAAALARGKKASLEDRVPAAVMAFASSARLVTAPAIALFEQERTRNLADTLNDLSYFQAADDLPPQEWADVALGRTRGLRTPVKPRRRIRSKFNRELDYYNHSYPLALAIAVIQFRRGKRHARLEEFFEWCSKNWLFSAPANLYAVRIFSSSPPKNALKDLFESDRYKALAGVRNFAWDMTYANHFMERWRRGQDGEQLTVFCSRDRLLSEITGDLRSLYEGSDVLKSRILASFGSEMLATYQSLSTRGRNAEGREYRDGKAYRLRIIRLLERELFG